MKMVHAVTMLFAALFLPATVFAVSGWVDLPFYNLELKEKDIIRVPYSFDSKNQGVSCIHHTTGWTYTTMEWSYLFSTKFKVLLTANEPVTLKSYELKNADKLPGHYADTRGTFDIENHSYPIKVSCEYKTFT